MLHLFNSLTHKIEDFKPIKAGLVKLYVCGPTVYNYATIGNLRAYIFADLLKRYLEYRNFKVKHVMNITDVGHLTSDADIGEDKLQKAAKKERVTAWDISKKYTEQFLKDIVELNIQPPRILCKATDHIAEQIALIKKLERKKYTYKTSDGIYFDTSKFSHYGELARLDIAGLKAGKRIVMGEKKNKTDFALWKFSKHGKKRDMEWDSPWGKGFPGWHIECSAMSMKYLGETFDIHTGGIDHIPIHHTNEIAQSEAATGKKFVNYWLHNAHLIVEGQKMSKSLGNFYTLKDIKDKKLNPLLLRLILLKTHYRQTLDFSFKNFNEAKAIASKFLNFLIELDFVRNKPRRLKGSGLRPRASEELEIKPTITENRKKLEEALDDDLNISAAMAELFNFMNGTNNLMSKINAGQAKEIKNFIFEIDSILGFIEPLYREYQKKLKGLLSDKTVKSLISRRNELRKNKNYKEADEIRKKLLKKGIIINDSEKGLNTRLADIL